MAVVSRIEELIRKGNPTPAKLLFRYRCISLSMYALLAIGICVCLPYCRPMTIPALCLAVLAMVISFSLVCPKCKKAVMLRPPQQRVLPIVGQYHAVVPRRCSQCGCSFEVSTPELDFSPKGPSES